MYYPSHIGRHCCMVLIWQCMLLLCHFMSEGWPPLDNCECLICNIDQVRTICSIILCSSTWVASYFLYFSLTLCLSVCLSVSPLTALSYYQLYEASLLGHKSCLPHVLWLDVCGCLAWTTSCVCVCGVWLSCLWCDSRARMCVSFVLCVCLTT